MTQTTCTKCQGSGQFFDITNADAIDAGPLANQCSGCRGRGIIIKVDLGTEARFARESAATMPEWDDTQDIPDWMCG